MSNKPSFIRGATVGALFLMGVGAVMAEIPYGLLGHLLCATYVAWWCRVNRRLGLLGLVAVVEVFGNLSGVANWVFAFLQGLHNA